MSNLNLKVLIAFLLTFPAFNACSTAKLPSEEPFLASQTDFKEYPNVPDFFTFNRWRKAPAIFKRVIIEHPLISINTQNGWRFANPDYLKFIADTLYKEVVKTLKKDFKIVKTAGPDTLRVRLVINNLTFPNHRVSIASRSAGLIPVGLNNTVLEAYFEDSLTDDLFGGIRDLRIGRKSSLKFMYGFTSPLYIQRAFDAWSTDLLSVLQDNFKAKDESKDDTNPLLNSELNYDSPQQIVSSIEEETIIEPNETYGSEEVIEEQYVPTPPPLEDLEDELSEQYVPTPPPLEEVIDEQYVPTPPPIEEEILPSTPEPAEMRLETYLDIPLPDDN